MAAATLINRNRKKQPHGIPDVHEIRKFCRIGGLVQSMLSSLVTCDIKRACLTHMVLGNLTG